MKSKVKAISAVIAAILVLAASAAFLPGYGLLAILIAAVLIGYAYNQYTAGE